MATERKVTKDEYGNKVVTKKKGTKKKVKTIIKKERASNAKPVEENPIVDVPRRKHVTKSNYASNAQPLEENPETSYKEKGTPAIGSAAENKSIKRAQGVYSKFIDPNSPLIK